MQAAQAHLKSVVLMKNHATTLPLRPERLGERKLYVELFEGDLRVAKLETLRGNLAEAYPGIRFTTDYHDADVAVLFLNPFTGDYFKSTGLLDLDIHEGTNINLAKISDIRTAVAEVVIGLNVVLPWLLGNVEPLADALVAGFDTRTEALFDIIVGAFPPERPAAADLSDRQRCHRSRRARHLRLAERRIGLWKGVVHGRPAIRLHRHRWQPVPVRSRPVLRLARLEARQHRALVLPGQGTA
jgi:hypothetical protein